MRHRYRFRAAKFVAVTVLALLAALVVTPSVASAAPSPGGVVAPKPPAGFEQAGVIKVKKTKQADAAQGMYIYCYIYVSDAFRNGLGVRSVTSVMCADEYGAFTAVDEIYIDTTIFRGGLPWESNYGIAAYTPVLDVPVDTVDCVSNYYYTQSYVQVVFPYGYSPPWADGVFYSPSNVFVGC